jgi:hypothetical protein
MSTQTTIDPKTTQSQELLQILLNLSTEEIAKLRRLLYYAEMLKRYSREESKATPEGVTQRPRRGIAP